MIKSIKSQVGKSLVVIMCTSLMPTTIAFAEAGNIQETETNVVQTTGSAVSVTDKTTVAAVGVTSVTLNNTSVSILVGKTATLTATVAPSDVTNKAVKWNSSDTNVATVDENGKVTGVNADAGTATITCTAQDGSGKSATCLVTILHPLGAKNEVTSVTLNNTSVSILVGKTATLTATVAANDATNKAVKWSSSDTNVTTVDENGSITGVGVGSATITCTAQDGSNKSATCNVTVTKATSSRGSSGGSGSSANTTSTGTGITTTGAGTTSITAQHVSIANITKEEAKAIEAKVINNVRITLGNGVNLEQAKEVTASDGTKVSVITITKDGKSAGEVITAEASSATATIPVSTEAGVVTKVYKYVPLLDKYIQLTDGVVIGANAITLPTQANATYVIATEQLATTEIVSAGWDKVGNNWYMINATGEPQVGWQKDSVGWAYLAPTDGVMQTGWVKDGNGWRYLRDNGYMVTGWVKDGGIWYYLNNDGLMASSTTVDGYKLGSNGAWISQ